MGVAGKSPIRRLVFLIGGALTIALLVIAVRHFSNSQVAGPSGAGAAVEAVPVIATTATRQDVPNLISAIGTVQSIDSVAIEPRVTGTIQKIDFLPGQTVKQGQELFLIDPRPYQAALDQAKAQLAHDRGVLAEAQMDLTRYQNLAKQNAINQQQAQDQAYVVQQAQGTVDLDQASIETAELNLEFTRVTAPISGRAGTLLVDVGNLVGPPGTQTITGSGASGQAARSTTLATIEQMQPIYVSFNVPQTRLSEIQHHQSLAPLDVDAFSQDGKLIGQGKLAVIDNQVNTNTGTVLMQATFANADEALWPGEFVRAQLAVSVLRQVLTVPTEAIMTGPNGSYVYVIGPDEKVKRVDVEVTAHQGNVTVIGDGLADGAKVVTDGQHRLDNGTKVVVRTPTKVSNGPEQSKTE